MTDKQILLIETFYGGSHKQLMDHIKNLFCEQSALYTMPAKKWHWRSLTSALHIARIIPKEHNFRVLLTSSVLPLSELLALRPDLMSLHKIVYFHENQFIYPTREHKKRYFLHAYNQVLSSMVADCILFNSLFNQSSFLSSLTTFFNFMPDFRPPKTLGSELEPKCSVLHFPIHIPILPKIPREGKLHILWPHRWEHDKDPETFFSVMYRLKNAGADFRLSVVGESFSEKPPIFDEAKIFLAEHIENWGYVESKEAYYRVLQSTDVAISTALHEFFGVAMLEATSLNCYPLCPKRLVYPEIYPEEHLYNTPNQLFKKLKHFCQHPHVVRKHNLQVDVQKFSWEVLQQQYCDIFTKKLS